MSVLPGRRFRPRRALLLALCLLVLCIAPAAAHTAANASEYEITLVTGIEPALPGVTATAAKDGSSVGLRNRTGTPLTVLGYQDEPYLRITATAVMVNEHSLTTYANSESVLDSVPRGARAGAEPRWVPSSEPARWHDSRISWTGDLPASVRRHPDKGHVLDHWRIPLRYGGRDAAILGEVRWRPTNWHATAVMWGCIGLVVVVVAVAGVLARGGLGRKRVMA